MKTIQLLASVFVLSSVAFAQSSSSLSTSCAGSRMSEVASLGSLPSPVLHLLGADRSDSSGIADHGAPFNPTDVHNGLPTRRLVAASVSPGCIVVTLEQGGIAHYFKSLMFLKSADGQWVAQSEPRAEQVKQIGGK
jgi:hypothetical protein